MLLLIVVLIIIGIVGIRRRQPQIMLVAGLALIAIIIGLVWIMVAPVPTGLE
ncbi:hypothetical protein [Lactiplantibacillus plajomi]|uniref:Uncharacterized protein n=1 Tax=Lactiplantibacillus plajomi TaxID=1457217 RepID=A0ABV6K5Z8_9LACO|nr:hypothetical protein [Lactiplantibacillus plajomi]